MSKTDLRVVKSKKQIRKAFLELMQEKGYSAITVKDIAERAIINRKTFYLHYETKEDLYNEITDEILNILKIGELLGSMKKTTKEGQLQIIRHFLLNLKKNSEICSIFLDDVTNPEFNNRVKKELSDALLSKTEIIKRTIGTNFTFEFLTEAYYTIFKLVFRQWINSKSDDPDVAIEHLLRFFSKEPLELLGLKY